MNNNYDNISKVELSLADYKQLVEKAQANDDEINRRAVELYRENGVCTVRLDVSIHKNTDFRDYEQYNYDLSSWVKEDEEYKPRPFCINSQMAKRIRKAAKDIAENAFYYNFGRQFMQMNNILKYRWHTEHIRYRLIAFTVAGWLMAMACLITMMVVIYC